ncbi:hypothetical protein ES702_06915 [subsurface metagenome]
MKVSKDLQVEILRKLYKAYSDCLFVDELKKGMPSDVTDKKVLGVCIYLEDKGYVVSSKDGWRITASGIEFLEEKKLV